MKVLAFDRKNNVEDTIMFEQSDKYVVQFRKDLKPVNEIKVYFEEENAYDIAEEIFYLWGVL